MKIFLIFIFTIALHATTYYVGSTGSDSNTPTQAQSTSTPWLTMNHAFGAISCGDTITLLANGSAVIQNGNAGVPYFPNCNKITTINSQNSALLPANGYRTNPAIDAANYGIVQFSNDSGWIFGNEIHGAWMINANNQSQAENVWNCNLSGISGATFTINYCGNGLSNFGIGTQVEFEVNGYNYTAAYQLPSGLTLYQVFYVVAYNAGAGTFQVSATQGGSAITPGTCNGTTCQYAAINFTQPLQVNVSTSTFTSPDAFLTFGGAGQNIGFQNGTAVTLNNTGLLCAAGQTTCNGGAGQLIMPAPTVKDTAYYVCQSSGRSFQLSSTPTTSSTCTTPVTLTAIGTGGLTVATIQSPSNWHITGIKFYFNSTDTIFGFLQLGSGAENSVLSMVQNVEVDHCFFLGDPASSKGLQRAILDNGRFLNIHDNFISGARNGESQAIAGTQALGPNIIKNNFMEASGENFILGGSEAANTGIPNGYHTISGNYLYTPPLWKISSGTTNASGGGCWYDGTDPNYTGGELYKNTSAGTWFQCNPSGNWASVGSGPSFSTPSKKDLLEWKAATHMRVVGNVGNYTWSGGCGSPCSGLQTGEALNLSQEPGSGAGIANDNHLIQNNAFYHAMQFVGVYTYCGFILAQPCPTQPVNHYYNNNLAVLDLNACGPIFLTGNCDSKFQGITFSQAYPTGITMNHNTLYASDAWGTYGGSNPIPVQGSYTSFISGCGPASPLTTNFQFQNNIWSGDWLSDCYNTAGSLAGQAISNNFATSAWINSVHLNGTIAGYSSVGSGNTFSHPSAAFPSSLSTIDYTVGSGIVPTNYKLASASVYSAQNGSATLLSTDGKDLGVDTDILNQATSGAIAGTPPWDVMYQLQTPAVAATQAVISYNAPTTGSCVTTVYSSVVRIPANVVGSAITDLSDANSVLNGSYRQILYTGLSANTTYPVFTVSCGGGVLMLGFNLRTPATAGAARPYNFQYSSSVQQQTCSDPAMSVSCSTDLAGTSHSVPVSVGAQKYTSVIGGGVAVQPMLVVN